MEPLKIVFVGVGTMGQMAHLRNYAVLPDCKVVAVVEARPELGKAVAARYGIRSVFTTPEELKASGLEFDGFVAIQQYRNQKNLLPELYAFGKPVLTEKPVALGVEWGEKLAALAAENGIIHVMGYHKRSDPAMEFAKTLSDSWRTSGKFGAFRYLRATMPAGDWIANGFEGMLTSDEPFPPADLEPDVTYFRDPELNKFYDVFVNYYIHQVNALRYLLGEDYHVTYADPTRTVLAAESVSGKPAVIEMSPWVNTVDWQESYLLAFDKGWIRVNLPAPLAVNAAGKVTVYEDAGDGETPRTWSPTLPHVHAMKNQAANYLRFLRGEIPPKCTAAEAVKDLETAREYVALFEKKA